MSEQALDLQKELLRDPRIESAGVKAMHDSFLLAEVMVREGSKDLSLTELLKGKRAFWPVVLVIKGSSENLDKVSALHRTQADAPYETAHSDDERRMIELWQELLNWSPVSRRDNFFDLGGDSLMGMEMIHHLSEEVGVTMDLSDLLNAPTLYEFTSIVSAARNPTSDRR